jgi:hypothetical protein
MQGTLIQIIALTIYGNAYLTDHDIDEFFPNNNAFKFCEYVRFVDLEQTDSGHEELPYAQDPVQWFARLQREGAEALRMIYQPSGGKQIGQEKVSGRMLVGFIGGGGRWLIEVQKGSRSDRWEGRWQIGDKDRKDQLIWRVHYGRVATEQPLHPQMPIGASGLKRLLGENLEALAEFATAHKLDNFATAFKTGLAALSSPEPFKNAFSSHFAPAGKLALAPSQLLAASQAAWVFGGMGSWNDLGFEGDDKATYERLSEDLYMLLNTAVVFAANATAPSVSITKPWWKLWG